MAESKVDLGNIHDISTKASLPSSQTKSVTITAGNQHSNLPCYSIEGQRALAASERIFGDISSVDTAAQSPPHCPNNCSKGKIYRDGIRYNQNGTMTQRWTCTNCGTRFSGKTLKRNRTIQDNAKYTLEAAELQFTKEAQTAFVGEPNGLLTQYMAYLEREAYSAESIYPHLIKRLILLKADLHDPENVKTIISKLTYKDKKTGAIKKAKNGTKMLYCAAYGALCQMLKINWSNPGYRQEEIEVYVPYESELDALINAASSCCVVVSAA